MPQMTRIFVVGCPRSGTTLLQTLLAGHPDLCSAPESHVFALLRERGQLPDTYATGAYMEFRDHMAGLPEHPKFPAPDLDDDALGAGFVSSMDAYARSLGCNGWIEKTPDHLYCIDTIKRHVPDAWFVHIVREPLPTIASLLEAAWKNPRDWGEGRTFRWAIDKWAKAAVESATWRGKPRHLTVCYEALCANAQAELARVADTMGIEFVPEMLDNAARGDMVTLGRETWKSRNSKPISSAGQAKVNRLFSKLERDFILAAIPADAHASGEILCPDREIQKPAMWRGMLSRHTSWRDALERIFTWRSRRRFRGNDR